MHTRAAAAEAVAAGRVRVAGAVAEKSSRLVAAGEPVDLVGPKPRYVSRGGEKLAAALDRFSLDVSGCTALDAGASTGGFTDCLLQHGATHVVALDVGHGQLDARLRADPRVTVLERVNVRHLDPAVLGPAPVDVVTADLSFISLVPLAPVLCGPVLRPGGLVVVLVKPQFEAGRAEVSRGRGVVREREVWRRTVASVGFALEAAGTGIMGAMASPLTGPAGNREFLLTGRRGAGEAGEEALEAMVDAAVEEAAALGGEA